ncbi:hypothetical protein QE152_g24287 [Popillia japonica]|uniref:Uncharacterized protein n=1 Tax=Popillia japonica TaxID=7064 RepID=A0AAW1KFN3_POPJA
MYRTPPKTQCQYEALPLPDSPADRQNNSSPSTPKVTGDDGEEETPTPHHSGSPAGVGDLTDDQIMEQIRTLQKLLDERRNAGVGDLTDDQIMEQIRTLQKLLDERRNSRLANRNLLKDLNTDDHQPPPGVSPVDMNTSFCSTASLVRAVGVSPVDMNTSFCSTASLVRAVCTGSSKKRKGSSSPLSSPRRSK